VHEVSERTCGSMASMPVNGKSDGLTWWFTQRAMVDQRRG
jgi:hypothetical protein